MGEQKHGEGQEHTQESFTPHERITKTEAVKHFFTTTAEKAWSSVFRIRTQPPALLGSIAERTALNATQRELHTLTASAHEQTQYPEALQQKLTQLEQEFPGKVRVYAQPLYHYSQDHDTLIGQNRFDPQRSYHNGTIYFSDEPVRGTNTVITVDKQSPLVLYNLSGDKPYYEAMLKQANQEGKGLFQKAHEHGLMDVYGMVIIQDYSFFQTRRRSPLRS